MDFDKEMDKGNSNFVEAIGIWYLMLNKYGVSDEKIMDIMLNEIKSLNLWIEELGMDGRNILKR